ncbi:hypothetical protein QYE76_052498 [Lolium multiflorum]|uniref:DUF4218 domain-containing protein n=1 Tax=Lolium multiflorum TaxID=4521 RepID=A0AAD8SUS8_LOLMU|nr:hypothetical protein QYE76_052498 [Lolium multiflorum]
MQQPTSTAEGAQCSPPSAAQPRQSSPTHVTIRIKKKKSTFFFFPENATAEERPGHVFDADKDDRDAKIMPKIQLKLLRIRAYLKPPRFAPAACRHRRLHPGRLQGHAIASEHAAGYKTTWRSAVECLIFNTSPQSLSDPQSLSIFSTHRGRCRILLRLAVDEDQPKVHGVALELRQDEESIPVQGIEPNHSLSSQFEDLPAPVIAGIGETQLESAPNLHRRLHHQPQGTTRKKPIGGGKWCRRTTLDVRRWKQLPAHHLAAAPAMQDYCRRTSGKDAPGKNPGMAAADLGQAQESLPAHQPRGAPAENALLPAHPWAGKLQGHLLTNGFMHGHTQWMSDDGAEVNGATAAGGKNGRQEGGHHDIDDDEEFVAQDDNLDDDNKLDDDEEVPLASVVRDPHLQDLLLEKKKGAKRKSKLEQLEIDSNTPLYDSGRGLGESRLRVALDVLQMKAKHGWTDTSVDDILEYVKDLLPAGNTCPGSLAEAKRITCPLDLPHEKYHACINDCIMYRKEHMDKTKCPVCEAERYKKGKKKAPRKVVWYFPPPAQRFYADRKEAKLMRWHAERKEAVLNDEERIEHPVLTHPSDASQWKALDNEFGSFGADPETSGWKECPASGKIRQKLGEKKKKKETTPLIGVWKRRSVFWDLPYWKILDTPHCLDVTHITKNVCKSLLSTLLNMPDRTKDGPKARHDLKVLGIREELQIPPAQEGQSEEEADGGVRVPFGYSGLISRYMDPKKRNFSGMKSHDCHSISVKKLARLQEEIVVILCELEMYFPPAFFDVMVHLLVHIMDDIVSLGPAFLHNMMPFERMNGVIKGYICNRSHPDGSIVQGWLTEECISFCTNYLDIEDPVGLPQNKHLRRFEGVGHKNGRKELHVHMSGRTSDFDRANLVALQHIDLIDPWLKEHKTMIENSGKPMMTEAEIYREHNSSFARWFKDHIDANPPPMDSDKDKLVLALSHGPAPNIMTYQAYDINGYTFYTEEKDKNSVYQNSGVTMDSWTGDVKTRYYGRIEEIWELSYAGEKVSMFRIRWAKSVTKEDRYFTTMFLPEANKSKSTNATAQNEPWVLAEHVHQCFFITDTSRPSHVIVRRGKRTIVGMDGVANEEDFEGQVGDPMMEESEDEDTTYTTRRSRTTLPSGDEPSGNEASDAAGGSTYAPSGDEATGAAGGGGETSGDDPSGAAGSSGTGTSGSKRPRKARCQNTVGTGRDTVKEVDPANGLPVEPKDVAKGYGNQLECILREVINLNETDLRAENKAHLRAQLIARLHSRYKFLGDYASTHQTKNIVNSQALLKFTKHLSSYKYMVRKLIAEGKGFEEVHSAFPHVSQADFDAFVANEELQATKNRKLWGKEMRELNIGNHNLGSRGYEGKEQYWEKEDEAYVNAGIENPWLKYKDPLERRFIRSRYHKKKLTGELVTDPKVITDII